LFQTVSIMFRIPFIDLTLKLAVAACIAIVFIETVGLTWVSAAMPIGPQNDKSNEVYLGFDRNQYPGDATLDSLRKAFSFAGFWLNNPPGEKSNTWQGKRDLLRSRGFGFLVLFNGRLFKELKPSPDPRVLGVRDAAAATKAAKSEGFPPGTIIFLDQEEGGRLLPEQRAYLYAWIDAVDSGPFRAGVYCSGIPAKEDEKTEIVTANDIRDNAGTRKIAFFVYNDACPPSPGCTKSGAPPSPQQSGIPFATVWQFAQSPRRRELTAACPSKYDSDGNCYAPLVTGSNRFFLDLDSSFSADPSSGR
jgi:hypothetical protein